MDIVDHAGKAVAIGIGATATIDLWSLLRARWLGVPVPDWGLVGRWLAHIPRGRFVHAPIAKATPVRGERVLGWVAHYAIGIVFASMLIAIAGANWVGNPRLASALLFGLGTVMAPLLVMQPGMGLGMAARRAPRPWAVRAHSLVTHAIFGVGLWASAEVLAFAEN